MSIGRFCKTCRKPKPIMPPTNQEFTPESLSAINELIARTLIDSPEETPELKSEDLSLKVVQRNGKWGVYLYIDSLLFSDKLEPVLLVTF